jgi:uncharacterized membrane protein (DUF4010 family)
MEIPQLATITASGMAEVGAGSIPQWPYLEMLARFTLALALGLVIGLERERRKKEAGLRTFGFIALLGAMGAALGDSYAYIMLCLTALLTVFLNIQNMRTQSGTELTTSAAMLVTCMVGILCGKGHTLTPSAVMVGTTALLAWKDRLQGFSIGLSESELRSALLLAILAIVIYPALPSGAIGPMGLIEPRAAWATVILIAGIGFVNYILWKLYGQRGVAIAGFLGGLVNSSVTISELSARIGNSRNQAEVAASYHGILLATSAMITRNIVILMLLAPLAALSASVSFVLMLVASAGWSLLRRKTATAVPEAAMSTQAEGALVLPFSLWSALKFGLIFLLLHVFGVLTQQYFGKLGFYLVSFFGGAVSSASAVAAAAGLAASKSIPHSTAATGAVIASLASVAINLPFIFRTRNRGVIISLSVGMLIIVGLGMMGLLLEDPILEWVHEYLPELERIGSWSPVPQHPQ